MPQGMRIGGFRAIIASVGVTLCGGLLGCNSTDKPKDSLANKQTAPLPGTPYLQSANGTTGVNGTSGTTYLNGTTTRPVTGSALPSTSFPTTVNQPNGNYAAGSSGTAPTVPNYNTGSTSSMGNTGFGTAANSTNMTGSAGGMPSGTQPSFGGSPNRYSGATSGGPTGAPGSLGVPTMSGVAGPSSISDPPSLGIIPPSPPQGPSSWNK